MRSGWKIGLPLQSGCSVKKQNFVTIFFNYLTNINVKWLLFCLLLKVNTYVCPKLFPLVYSFDDNWTKVHECIRNAVLYVFYNFFELLNKACHLGWSPVSAKPRTEESSYIQCSLSVYTGQTDLSTDTREKQHHGHICLRKSAVAENGFTTNNASNILSIKSVTVTAISGRHLRLRSFPTTWPGLEQIMEILNKLLQDNATTPHPNTQPTQLPGCQESVISLLPVWPLAFLTACLQFLPSMFLCPLSPDFCYIVSPTTHVFQSWLHYLYIYHNSHWPTAITFSLYAIVTFSLQGLFFLDYNDDPCGKLLRNAGTYKTIYKTSARKLGFS